MSKFTKKCMAIRTLSDTESGCHTFLCKFCRFQITVSQSKLAWLTPNLGILWISVCSFWLCGSIVANPIIYRLVPSPSRFEIRKLNPGIITEGGIICGPHRGSFAVRDHLRSIWGSFPVWGSFAVGDHLRRCTGPIQTPYFSWAEPN